MRKIIVFNLLSLDGYFAGADGNIDWHNVDSEFNDFAVEQTSQFGGIIFGKMTYQIFEEFWPKVVNDKKMSKEDRKIAQIIDDVWKIVVSKSLKKVTWKNSKLYHDIDHQEVKQWKAYDGKDLVIFGSGTIVQQMTKLKLIDEYRFLINPVVLGKGKPMFANQDEMLKLTLVATRKFKNGNILLTYRPVSS
jgi:dihydrofolate reductase